MALAELVATVLLLTAVSSSSNPFKSSEDQYHQLEPEANLHSASKATDWLSKPPDHLNPNFKETQSKTFSSPPQLNLNKFQPNKRQVEEAIPHKSNSRVAKRSYYPYQGGVIQQSVVYPSITHWKAPVYQLSRPYYIPIYGVDGRVPMYFPPQPVYINPGVPPDNPRPPYVGPTYLPPSLPPAQQHEGTEKPPYVGPTYLPPFGEPTQPPSVEQTTMWLGNKFNGDDNPVWDYVDSSTRRPVVPPNGTRRPGNVPSTHPPLNRQPNKTKDVENVFPGNGYVPPPPAVQQPPNQRPIPSTPRPAAQQPPAASQQRQPQPAVGPTRCVWAIISCCSTKKEVPDKCFEELGCQGPFWDKSPCESEYAEAAIASAMNYYETSN